MRQAVRGWLQTVGQAAYACIPSQSEPSRLQQDGRTPLAVAAVNGKAVVVRAMLASGANPNLATRSGVTPLLEACKCVCRPWGHMGSIAARGVADAAALAGMEAQSAIALVTSARYGQIGVVAC